MTDEATELHARIAELTAERDALKQALAEADVYQLAVQHAPFGVMSVSLKTGRYRFSNPVHAKMLGCTPEEVMASDPHRRWHEVGHRAGRLAAGVRTVLHH